MQATIGKMETGIHSIRSELENTKQRTQNLRKELTETVEKTQVALQTVEVALCVHTREFRREIAAVRSDVTNANTHGTFNETRSQIEATKRKFNARLEAVEARAELGRAQGVGTSTVQPPTFNGNTSWSVFRPQFETVTEHNHWLDKEKSTYLITELKGQTADVLHGFPTNMTYEGTLQALEDRFGDQHFAAAYRCQLTTRTQEAGESLQDFATAVEQLAHRAYHTLPEEYVWREAGRAFAYGVADPDINIQLLLGGQKTVNEAFRHALELQAVLVAAKPRKITPRYRGEPVLTQPTKRYKTIGMLELWRARAFRE
jgi:hypothetical protein